MVRIAGADIPDNKKVAFSLRYIYGVGPSRADEIIERSGVDPDRRVHELTEQDMALLRSEPEPTRAAARAPSGRLPASAASLASKPRPLSKQGTGQLADNCES